MTGWGCARLAVVVCWGFWLELGVKSFPVLYFYGMWYMKILKSIGKPPPRPLRFRYTSKGQGQGRLGNGVVDDTNEITDINIR